MSYGPDTRKLMKLLAKYEKFIQQPQKKRSRGFKLDLMYLNLHSLPDLRPYTKLRTLWVIGKQFTTLPPLPDGLRDLTLYDTSVTSLPERLPPRLKELDCDLSPISVMPPLPCTLEVLNCRQTLLTRLPELPPSLHILKCNESPISELPRLPPSLRNLSCEETQITCLPELPDELTLLRCYGTQITSLPKLPDALRQLDCSQTFVKSLPALPSKLDWLRCERTPIASLPNIPESLRHLYIAHTQVRILPKLPNHFYYEDYGLSLHGCPLLIPFIKETMGSYCSYLMQWDELREGLEEKERVIARTKVLAEHIIAAGWHPDRFERWCLDEEEKKENDAMFV
jgi:Leucine-rich repeat (LRR) protein